MDWMVEDSGGVEDGPNIRKRIGQTVIYGESRYMKRNGLDGPKYKEKDWTKSDLRGVQIYEEEWTGGVGDLGWVERIVRSEWEKIRDSLWRETIGDW